MVLVGSPHLPAIWREYPRIVQKDKSPSYPVLHMQRNYYQKYTLVLTGPSNATDLNVLQGKAYEKPC